MKNTTNHTNIKSLYKNPQNSHKYEKTHIKTISNRTNPKSQHKNM